MCHLFSFYLLAVKNHFPIYHTQFCKYFEVNWLDRNITLIIRRTFKNEEDPPTSQWAIHIAKEGFKTKEDIN
tara:strand:- start:175 stop:390 length:216 start_codon:yes stop_codon:yes gene_type:complete